MTEREKDKESKIDQKALGEILIEAQRVLVSIGKEGEEIVQEGTSFGDTEADTEIAADKKLAHFFLLSFSKILKGQPFSIQLEGLNDNEPILRNTDNAESAKYHITVDPLDASLNYKLKGETQGLPYSTVVGIFDNPNPRYKDCFMAGTVDLRNGDTWLSERGKGTTINDKSAKASGKKKLDLANGIVIGELYYPENRELLVKAFKDQKGWLRNPGSAAYEMSLVASGQADAYLCDRQKSHELGAAYRLVTEAGGYVCDFEGNELGEREYDFNSQVPVILAATKNLAEEIVERVNI